MKLESRVCMGTESEVARAHEATKTSVLELSRIDLVVRKLCLFNVDDSRGELWMYLLYRERGTPSRMWFSNSVVTVLYLVFSLSSRGGAYFDETNVNLCCVAVHKSQS